jgi:hypothetical protein
MANRKKPVGTAGLSIETRTPIVAILEPGSGAPRPANDERVCVSGVTVAEATAEGGDREERTQR